LFGTQRAGPLLTLSWDEDHILTKHVFNSLRQTSEWTQLDEFRQVLIDCDRTGRLFSLFLSTNAKIDQFSPDSRNNPSSRIERQKLTPLPPFINLEFDQFADELVDLEEGFELSKAIKPEWIVKFGRPM
jgi:hypothetical protein